MYFYFLEGLRCFYSRFLYALTGRRHRSRRTFIRCRRRDSGHCRDYIYIVVIVVVAVVVVVVLAVVAGHGIRHTCSSLLATKTSS